MPSIESEEIDTITLRIVWNRLQDIPQEMGTHLSRTAFSQVLKHAADFSTGLFTWDGKLIAQGMYSPGFLGCMPTALQTILDEHVSLADWEPGDLVVTNNPYIGAGHFPDVFTFEPVFFEDSLIGFCATVAHHADLGGRGPGSGPIDANSWYEEGLHIPPVKLSKAGADNDELLTVVLQNSRLPEQLAGDLKAQRAASAVGKKRYRELFEEYGIETTKRYFEEILSRTEVTMRDAIRDVPDGEYSFEETLDGVDEPLPLCVTVHVNDDELVVDFEGTAAQCENAAINSTQTYTNAYALYTIKTLIDPETPNTAGSNEQIEFTAPPRTIVNPEPPVPLSKRHVIANHIVSAINGALADILPDETVACGAQTCLQSFNFDLEESDEEQILVDFFFGGAGARPNRDGYPAIAGVHKINNTPVESIEAEYPIRIRQYELVPDSAGAGRFRGGSATVRDYELLQPAAVQAACERFEFGPFGLADGNAGETGLGVINPGGDDERRIDSKSRFEVDEGDILRTVTPGGGGHGAPSGRDPDAIHRDIANEIVSESEAREAYDFID